MKNFNTIVMMAMAIFIFCFHSSTQAQGKPYKDGSVWNLTLIKTTAGMSDEYFKSLKITLKPMYEEAIRQGLLVSYKILQGPAANDDDFEIAIMTEYKNMAATEGHDEQWEAIRNKVIGGAPQELNLMKERLNIRQIMGEKLMREVILN